MFSNGLRPDFSGTPLFDVKCLRNDTTVNNRNAPETHHFYRAMLYIAWTVVVARCISVCYTPVLC